MTFELPLFPLNTVLFPGMPLNLHIFEPRYKAMIQHCLDTDRLFGVVLIEHGLEAGSDLATPHLVGCTAHIAQVERLEEGRLNLMAVGQERFRTATVDRTSQPYLVGHVNDFPLPTKAPDALAQEVGPLRPLVNTYLERLSDAGQATASIDRLVEDPLLFCYLAATLLQISPRQKQDLLLVRHTEQLARNLRTIYRRELMLLDVLLTKPDEDSLPTYRLN